MLDSSALSIRFLFLHFPSKELRACTSISLALLVESSAFPTQLQANCPQTGGDDNLAPLDSQTPKRFGNNYFQNLVNNKGLLHSDQELFNNGAQDPQVPPPIFLSHSSEVECRTRWRDLNMHEEAAVATVSPRLLYQHFDDDHTSGRHSIASSIASPDRSPYNMSPWHASASSPQSGSASGSDDGTSLVASLVREEGHIYSLAAVGDLLYTGSDSKNIRVWKNQTYFSGFKSTSGLVKAIVIAPGDHRIFTGHQDGKIRVWKVSHKNSAVHKRIGSLPKFKHLLKSSMKPSSYIDIRRHRTSLWNKHADAISCLCFSEDHGLLYSGSWDKTFKVWRIADFKCLESVLAHDDAVNSIVVAFDGLVVTGSADGSVKVWRRELHGKGTSHSHTQTLIKQESAVTALAVSTTDSVLYAGSSDGVVNFWEGERHHTHGGVLRGHNMAVLCLAAAGSLVLSGSADNTICVWRREGGVHSCLSVLTGHGGPVKCLTVLAEEEDGGGATGSWILYSGSLDKSVKVWRVCEQAQEALLQGPQNIPVGPEASCGGGAHSYDSSVGLEGNSTRVQAVA